MADTTTPTVPPKKDDKNWADMDHDEEDEHEDIGLQETKKETPAAEEDKKDEGGNA